MRDSVGLPEGVTGDDTVLTIEAEANRLGEEDKLAVTEDERLGVTLSEATSVSDGVGVLVSTILCVAGAESETDTVRESLDDGLDVIDSLPLRELVAHGLGTELADDEYTTEIDEMVENVGSLETLGVNDAPNDTVSKIVCDARLLGVTDIVRTSVALDDSEIRGLRDTESDARIDCDSGAETEMQLLPDGEPDGDVDGVLRADMDADPEVLLDGALVLLSAADTDALSLAQDVIERTGDKV